MRCGSVEFRLDFVQVGGIAPTGLGGCNPNNVGAMNWLSLVQVTSNESLKVLVNGTLGFYYPPASSAAYSLLITKLQ